MPITIKKKLFNNTNRTFYWFISSALSIFLMRYANLKLNNYDPPRHKHKKPLIQCNF